MTVVGQSEVDAYACRVLRKHWPTVPNLGDITKITEADVERLGPIDLVCGGFPCQDLSVAGKQGGIKASRSGLFWELMRVVRLVRPHFVLLENVPALLSRSDWMGAVLGELAACGFDAEWDCIPAQAVGAPHRRDRVFIVAHTDERRDGREGRVSKDGATGAGAVSGVRVVRGGLEPTDVAHAAGEQGRRIQQRGLSADAGAGGQDVADAQDRPGLRVGNNGSGQKDGRSGGLQEPLGGGGRHGWPRPSGDWLPEPDVGRVANGVPARVDRLRGLGNAVVPQVAEHVGRIIMQLAEESHPEQRQTKAQPEAEATLDARR
jgi:DNA (cytosine-5)-methyltransferase 1